MLRIYENYSKHSLIKYSYLHISLLFTLYTCLGHNLLSRRRCGPTNLANLLGNSSIHEDDVYTVLGSEDDMALVADLFRFALAGWLLSSKRYNPKMLGVVMANEWKSS